MLAAVSRVPLDVEAGVVRGKPEALTTGTHTSIWPEPSPDGTRLAFHRGVIEQEDIYVSAANGGEALRLTDDVHLDRVARWSADGRHLAFYSARGGQANIWVVDADGRNLRQVTHSTRSPVIFAAWAPDGRLAASELGPGFRAFVFDPDKPWDEANLVVLPRPDAAGHFVPWSWSPDGRRLAGFRRPVPGQRAEPAILVLSVDTGEYTKVPCEAQQPPPVWLPDGRRLVYAAQNRLLLLDLTTGRSRQLLDAGPGRLELAAGGGFAVSAATGHIYIAPVLREGDIWLAAPK
jgi:TolB protein